MRTPYFDGITVFRLYGLLVSRFFGSLVYQNSLSNYVRDSAAFFYFEANERDALVSAVKPFVLLRPQRSPLSPAGVSLERLLELLREVFAEPRQLFRVLYPDLYTEFTFPGLQTLF